MNIMLVNVHRADSRDRIRVATGARTRIILQQFIVEALVVSAIGGAARCYRWARFSLPVLSALARPFPIYPRR